MTHSPSTRPKRAALALACAGVLAGSLGISAGAHATGTSTARQPVVRMDDLLHPADVAGAFAVAGTTTSRVGAGNGDFGLSGCTGETRTSDVVGSGAHLFHEVLTGAVGGGGEPVHGAAAHRRPALVRPGGDHLPRAAAGGP